MNWWKITMRHVRFFDPPAQAAEWPCSFALGQKNQNPTAASAASNVTAEAQTVQPAPAEAEEKVNGGSVGWLKKLTQRLDGAEGLACGPLGNEQVT